MKKRHKQLEIERKCAKIKVFLKRGSRMKKTKIICSIGPASCNPDTMEQMVNVGMNVARINFSHATEEEKKNVVATVHEVRNRTKKAIAILYDTKGPEFRSGMLENDEITLTEGKTIRVVKETVLGNENRISVNHPQAIAGLNVGDVILLENGLMKLSVISCEEDGVTCEIIVGGVLGNKKSLSVPGVQLDIPFISEQDRNDIIYACEHEGDFLALSFVSTKEDVLETRKILKECMREDLKIISKIESSTGIKNIDSIIEVSDGIMVARGDLGVEVPLEQLPVFQKMLVRKCREQGKIAVVATEMLESMKKNARPTRAEVSDVANAVMDGTDAVMLSGETTTGKYPAQTVEFMGNICLSTENYLDYTSKVKTLFAEDITSTIARGIVEATNALDIKAIVAATTSGYTARKISNLRPKNIILTACPTDKVAYSLALNFGVCPFVEAMSKTTDELVTDCTEIAKKEFGLTHGDKVIITGGFPNHMEVKKTNFMKIEEI